jgi:transketolase
MGSTATRAAFGEALVSLGEKYPNLVVVDADLSKSTMTGGFAKKFPQRHFDIGIAEAISSASAPAGSRAKFLSSAASPAFWPAFRADSAVSGVHRFECAIGRHHAGIGIGEDGYSQMALEDISLMRSLPNVDILQADRLETLQAVEFSINHNRPAYLRLTRQKLEDVHDASYRFQFGKGDVLREGGDVLMIATGGLVKPALDAAQGWQKMTSTLQW